MLPNSICFLWCSELLAGASRRRHRLPVHGPYDLCNGQTFFILKLSKKSFASASSRFTAEIGNLNFLLIKHDPPSGYGKPLLREHTKFLFDYVFTKIMIQLRSVLRSLECTGSTGPIYYGAQSFIGIVLDHFLSFQSDILSFLIKLSTFQSVYFLFQAIASTDLPGSHWQRTYRTASEFRTPIRYRISTNLVCNKDADLSALFDNLLSDWNFNKFCRLEMESE